jgi:hypothetical protein
MHQRIRTIVLSVGLLWASVLHAATYTFTSLDVPGSTSTSIHSVNDQGHLVGNYLPVSPPLRGFYYDGSSFTDVLVVGCPEVQAFGVNNNNEIVGDCLGLPFTRAFFLAPSGTQSILDAPGADSTHLNAINLPGYMAGGFTDAQGFHGAITDSTAWTTVDVPNSSETIVWGLNDSNAMAGQYREPNPSTADHGFITTDGVNFTPLDFPGVVGGTIASGISNAG